jgi:hypothetical protein
MASAPERQSGLLGLTSASPALKIEKPGGLAGFLFAALPPRSMVGQLPLEQHIGVRIPGGQPIYLFLAVYRNPGKSKEVHRPAGITYSF